jgi:hypothetical protein
MVAERGGRLAYGWALADHGPLLIRKRPLQPLYSRWINHVVWTDHDGRLWEVTPHCEVSDHERTAWLPSIFLPDPEAAPRIGPDGLCDVKPARYFSLRSAGQAVVHCLNRLHIDGPWHEAWWLERSMRELEIVGLAPAYWRVERVAGRLNNVWLFAE